jgi:hypothetical protein
MNSVGYGCPTVADDMLLLSLTPGGLQSLIDICYENSCKERYLYNPSKCKIVIYNESTSNKLTNVKWNLGSEQLEIAPKYLHLGVLNNSSMDLGETIADSCCKIRQTYFSLVDSGLNRERLHPLTLKKLYLSIVLPKGIFGCELWNNLSFCKIEELEKTHRKCIKHMQAMPKHTSTSIALHCLAIDNIETMIDKRKLLFFGQLCNAKDSLRIKDIFVNRLLQYMNKPRASIGFMPDLYRIFGKYKLTHFLTEFINKAIFPTKTSWKTIVKNSMKAYIDFDFKSKIINNINTSQFYQMHSENIPCILWNFSSIYREQLDFCMTAMSVLSRLFSRKFNSICMSCSLCVDDLAKHVVLFCQASEGVRDNMWKSLHTCLGDTEFLMLISLPIDQQLLQLLSGFYLLNIDDFVRVKSFKTSLKCIHKLAYKLRRQPT